MKLPSVGFLSDHYARTITGDRNRDYSYMVSEKLYRSALINQGFDVVDVKLSRNSQLLDSLDVLVVSEPREPFSEEELDKLYRYVESGKNLIIAGKPRTNSYLAPLMEKLGLRFEPGILVQKQDQIADKNAASMAFCQRCRVVAPELWGRPRKENIRLACFFVELPMKPKDYLNFGTICT